MSKQITKTVTIKKLDKSKIEITGSIEPSVFSSFRKQALQNINNEVTLDGFRKGKVPENILLAKIGEMALLEEMAQIAISKAYPEIIVNEKIDALGRPEINITKMALDNPLEFKIITTVAPEIKLGDYTKIAKKHTVKTDEVFEVTDTEVEEAITKIKASHADHEGHDHDSAEYKEKVKQYLLENKKIQAQEKRRIALSDALLEASTFEIPELLVESETRRIEAQFSDDIARMGVTLEDYLKHAKKTLEDLKTEWRPFAEKKAKLQLILNEIGKVEKIQVDPEEIEDEVTRIVAHYKDADREHAYTYAETVLTNEKIYQFLEN